jgi:type IV secretion system protein VirB9
MIGKDGYVAQAWVLLAVMLMGLNNSLALAGTIPSRSQADERVRYVDYKSDDVVVIATALGVVTRIVFADGETIARLPDAGFPSNCDDPTNEWCIRAEVGQSQFTVKPRRGATQNNLELSTTKRDYSFVMHKMEGNEKAKTVYYRVIFRYPMPVLTTNQAQVNAQDTTVGKAFAPSTSKYIKPIVRNTDYSFKAEGASRSLQPSVIFDDGRFTYFKFENAREVPAVFATDAKGEEIRVSFHAERLLSDPQNPDADVERDYLVLNRVAPMWRLRIEDLVAEVVNNNYDPKGVETYNGTTVPTLRRENK